MLRPVTQSQSPPAVAHRYRAIGCFCLCPCPRLPARGFRRRCHVCACYQRRAAARLRRIGLHQQQRRWPTAQACAAQEATAPRPPAPRHGHQSGGDSLNWSSLADGHIGRMATPAISAITASPAISAITAISATRAAALGQLCRPAWPQSGGGRRHSVSYVVYVSYYILHNTPAGRRRRGRGAAGCVFTWHRVKTLRR